MKTLGFVGRKYYKYDTAHPIYGGTIIGSLTNNNGVLSGFTTDDYLMTGTMPSWNNIEIVIKFKAYSYSTKSYISGCGNSTLVYKTPAIYLGTDGSIKYYYTQNSHIDCPGTISTNTWYWLKLTYNGSEQAMWLSTDGINYTKGTSISRSVTYDGGPWWIGCSNDGSAGNPKFPFNGEIDLKESYVKIQEEYWWRGLTYPVIDGTPSDYDYYQDLNNCQCFYVDKELVRHYYKYNYSTFEQPTMEWNGILGGEDFAVWASTEVGHPAYTAFDNNESSFWNGGRLTVDGHPDFIIYNPIDLKITNWQYNIVTQHYSKPEEGSMYGSNDGETWTLIAQYSIPFVRGQKLFDISLNHSNYYKYYKWHVTSSCSGYKSGDGWWDRFHIPTVNLTATERTSIESTSSDYDYYEDVWEVPRKYYKYQYKAFQQPILQKDGIMGVDDFAVDGAGYSSGYAYRAFDGDSSTAADIQSANVKPYLGMYSKNPLNITSLALVQHSGNTCIKTGTVTASNDGVTWDTLLNIDAPNQNNYTLDLSSNTGYYHYYRINLTTAYYSLGGVYYCYVDTCTITATERTITESTADDYDYYEESQGYKCANTPTVKYYKYISKSWGQDRLKGNGLPGGNGLAVWATSVNANAAYQAWKAFDDPSGNTMWYSASNGLTGGTPVYIGFYYHVPLNVTQLVIKNSTNAAYAMRDYEIEASNTNESDGYITLTSGTAAGTASEPITVNLSNNTGFYKYYRVKILNAGTSKNSGQVTLQNIEITATQRGTQLSNENDYDFYVVA